MNIPGLLKEIMVILFFLYSDYVRGKSINVFTEGFSYPYKNYRDNCDPFVIEYNPATKTLLCCSHIASALYSTTYDILILVIDTENWEITRSINYITTPSTPLSTQYLYTEGTRCYPGFVLTWSPFCVQLYNEATNSFKEYNFNNYPNYGINKTIDYDVSEVSISDCVLDIENRRIYVLWTDSYVWHPQARYGFISMDDPGDSEGFYAYNHLWEVRNGEYAGYLSYNAVPHICVSQNEDYVVISGLSQLAAHGNYNYIAGMVVLNFSTNGVYKFYTISEYKDFPVQGVRVIGILNNILYASCFDYIDTETGKYKKGLMILDLSTDVIHYSVPTWGTYDDYTLRNGKFIENNTKNIFCF